MREQTSMYEKKKREIAECVIKAKNTSPAPVGGMHNSAISW